MQHFKLNELPFHRTGLVGVVMWLRFFRVTPAVLPTFRFPFLEWSSGRETGGFWLLLSVNGEW